MGDMTRNFSRSEFACQGKNCCDHSSPINPALVEGLQFLRDQVFGELGVDTPLVISSGYRCNKHNSDTDGAAPNSMHKLGIACDVMCPEGLTVDEFFELAEDIYVFHDGGIGIYHNRLHLDIRRGKARWDKRKK